MLLDRGRPTSSRPHPNSKQAKRRPEGRPSASPGAKINPGRCRSGCNVSSLLGLVRWYFAAKIAILGNRGLAEARVQKPVSASRSFKGPRSFLIASGPAFRPLSQLPQISSTSTITTNLNKAFCLQENSLRCDGGPTSRQSCYFASAGVCFRHSASPAAFLLLRHPCWNAVSGATRLGSRMVRTSTWC